MTKAYAEGTLLPDGRGFQFAESPVIDLLDPRYLTSEDPDEIVYAVLMRARRGDFTQFRSLADLMRRTDDADIWNSCDLLIAYAAPYTFIREWSATYAFELCETRVGHIQEYIGRILGRSCGLWAAKDLLRMLVQVRDRNEYGNMPVFLSYLLEPGNGDIYWGPKSVDVPDPFGLRAGEPPSVFDDAGYRELVEGRLAEVTTSLGGRDPARTAVFEGELLSMQSLVEKTLERINAGMDDERIGTCRLLFEAYTGIDCFGFYNKHSRVQPLTASAILEQYLNDVARYSFEPGVRYFFGHRIPD